MYRQAAIDAHFLHQYGQVSMMPKVSQVMLTLLLSAWVLTAIVFISTQPFHDTVEVKGWVETSIPNVAIRSQEQAGVIEQVFVENGDSVTAGQVIATIVRSQGDAMGSQGIARQQANIKDEHTQNLAILTEKRNAVVTEAHHLTKRIEATRQQLTILDEHLNSQTLQTQKTQSRWQALKEMAALGTISVSQLEQSELQILSLQQGKLDLFVQSQQLKSALLDLQQRQQSNENQQTQYAHEQQLLILQTEQKQNALSEQLAYTVRASASGVIDNLQAHVGKSVSFKQVLTQISPNNPSFFVRLAIPSYQAAFIQLGQQVQVKVDGFPYQQFGSLRGTVTQMANEIIMPADVQHYATPINQAVYLIDIGIDYQPATNTHKEISLRSGMTIQASIQKQQKTILEWLLAPLLDTLTPSFNNKEVSK